MLRSTRFRTSSPGLTPAAACQAGVYLHGVAADSLLVDMGPYGYLARTIGEFPDPPALAGRIREAGFAACGWKNLSGGIVAIHSGVCDA